MDQKKIKKIILILFVLIILIILLIIYLLKSGSGNLLDFGKQNEDNNETNSTDNNVIQQNLIDYNNTDYSIPDEVEEIDPWLGKDVISQDDIKLEEKTDAYTYFLMKQCLTNYYNTQTVEKALNMLANESKDKLNINANNVSSFFTNRVQVEFCIDKILEQRLDAQDSSKNIYVVYHRLQNNTNTVVLVKIDKRNVDFSIYPYEYVSQFNYLNLQANDVITISNEDIEKNSDNGYKVSLISTSEQAHIKEFFERYKFDIKYDVEGLYNKIDEKYRNIKFNNLNDFRKYIENSKDDTLNGKISKYQVINTNDYDEYVVILENNNHYIFDAKNLMDYKIFLDNYTTEVEQYKDVYNSSFPNVQAQYSIDRIIKAINEKNYQFVYEKLNPVQKNNFYPNIDSLTNYIKDNFYDENSYELDRDYMLISSDVYQYDMKLTDVKDNNSHKEVTMAVTLKDDADFYVSIVVK